MSEQTHSDPTGPNKGNGAAIPDPDVAGTGSKYASRGAFGIGPAIRAYTPVTLGKSKTFMRANLGLATTATVVDAAKANATGRDLYLVVPSAVDEGALDGIATGYDALLVPMIDRDGLAFMWPIRRATRDGVQLDSYDSAMIVLPQIVDAWGRLQWQGSGYVLDWPYRVESLGEPRWPPNLASFDNWADAAFRGKIITSPDHKILQYLRAEI